MRFLFLISILCSLNAHAQDISKFKIISAEVLNYHEGNSVLIGNVEIQYGDYTFKAPKVYLNKDKENGQVARFVNGASLSSENLDIIAPNMEVDLLNSIFKCFANDDGLVETRIYDKNQSEPLSLSSWYQEFNIASGFAKANGRELFKPDGSSYQENLSRIKFKNKDLNIDSDSIEMQTNKGSVEYIDFIGQVVAKDDKQRTESKELFYFPTQDLIKAQGEVKILYSNENQPSYIFSDLVIYERNKSLFSAMSTRPRSKAEVYSDNTRGEARQIVLTMNNEDKPEKAILTGNAYAQYQDKSMLGHEVILDIEKKSIETIVGRPKTQILKI